MRYVFRNIVRFPKKTIVIFILVSIVLLLSMSGMFVITLCKEISDRTVGPLGGTVVVTDTDGERFMLYEAAKDICSVSAAIESVEAVAEYDIQPLGTKCINGADSINVYYSYYRGMAMDMNSNEDHNISTVAARDMKLTAVTTTDICKEFYSGEAELVEGSLISREDCDRELMKIVVSDKLAELNGLKLGDRVKINALSIFLAPPHTTGFAYGTDEAKEIIAYYTYEDLFIELGEKLSTMTFTIGGIYRNLIDNSSFADEAVDLNDNRVYVPISVVSKKLDMINSDKNFREHLQGYAYLKTLFPKYLINREQYLFPQDLRCVPTRLYLQLDAMSDVEGLEEEMNGFNFYKTVKLTPFTNEAGTSPAAKILIIVRYSLIGVMAVGFAILLLVIIFNKNARKREFAILAALGMKRIKIALSFFGEVFVVFIAALLVCTAIYTVTVRSVAAPVSEYLENYEETVDSKEVRMSTEISENVAKQQRSENMRDIGFLVGNYLMPSLLLTIISAASVLLLVLILIYISAKQINPLTESGGKE